MYHLQVRQNTLESSETTTLEISSKLITTTEILYTLSESPVLPEISDDNTKQQYSPSSDNIDSPDTKAESLPSIHKQESQNQESSSQETDQLSKLVFPLSTQEMNPAISENPAIPEIPITQPIKDPMLKPQSSSQATQQPLLKLPSTFRPSYKLSTHPTNPQVPTAVTEIRYTSRKVVTFKTELFIPKDSEVSVSDQEEVGSIIFPFSDKHYQFPFMSNH